MVCMSSTIVSVEMPPISRSALARINEVDPHQNGPAPSWLRAGSSTWKNMPCSPVTPSSSNAPEL